MHLDFSTLQLRVNGFSFGLYFGVWTTINAAQMLFLWGAIMGLIQIYQGRGDSILEHFYVIFRLNCRSQATNKIA